VLVTGGAGFIGSHLVDRLVEAGYGVRVLGALLPQVHASGGPSFVNRQAEFQQGDVRDAEAVRKALVQVDVVVHFAAAVGVGQSMHEIAHYSSVNVLGTATLLDVLMKGGLRPRRMIVALLDVYLRRGAVPLRGLRPAESRAATREPARAARMESALPGVRRADGAPADSGDEADRADLDLRAEQTGARRDHAAPQAKPQNTDGGAEILQRLRPASGALQIPTRVSAPSSPANS
jgi:NAD(P)-dependent dehydrogenase (short-subunit alcohol dehydrogenase family)